MEFNVRKHTKPDFSNFVALTLENRMPWKTLNSLLFDLAPSLNETREIICILLKELETLQSTVQKKEKELAKYENSSFPSEIQKCKSNFEHHKNTTDEVQEHEEQSSMPENENVENEIEILEVVKERMNDEILLNVNEETEPSDTFVNNENNEHDSGEAEESMGEIDNEWYTFVKDAKTIVPETEAPVQEKEFYLETEPTSSYENKDDRHVTEDNENDEDKSLKEVQTCTA